jgi:hypothetical protein
MPTPQPRTLPLQSLPPEVVSRSTRSALTATEALDLRPSPGRPPPSRPRPAPLPTGTAREPRSQRQRGRGSGAARRPSRWKGLSVLRFPCAPPAARACPHLPSSARAGRLCDASRSASSLRPAPRRASCSRPSECASTQRAECETGLGNLGRCLAGREDLRALACRKSSRASHRKVRFPSRRGPSSADFRRTAHRGEAPPSSEQIAGHDPRNLPRRCAIRDLIPAPHPASARPAPRGTPSSFVRCCRLSGPSPAVRWRPAAARRGGGTLAPDQASPPSIGPAPQQLGPPLGLALRRAPPGSEGQLARTTRRAAGRLPHRPTLAPPPPGRPPKEAGGLADLAYAAARLARRTSEGPLARVLAEKAVVSGAHRVRPDSETAASSSSIDLYRLAGPVTKPFGGSAYHSRPVALAMLLIGLEASSGVPPPATARRARPDRPSAMYQPRRNGAGEDQPGCPSPSRSTAASG